MDGRIDGWIDALAISERKNSLFVDDMVRPEAEDSDSDDDDDDGAAAAAR